MTTYPGVAAGTVREIDDALGRVRVNLPWLSDDNQTYWARIATLMAGDGRGSWFMPEVGDEVLVAFEMGKIDHPYVIGFLWSEKDKPPVKDDAIDPSVRRLRTVKNHRIDFDDRDGKERVLVQSQSEHALELSDAEKFVELRSNGKRLIRLDDQSPKIEIHTAGTPKIDLDEQGSKITIETAPSKVVLSATSVKIEVGANSIEVSQSGITISATGSLMLKGTTVTLASDGPLTLQGALVSLTASSILSVTTGLASFTGAVQATSIISPSYTPGAGNML